MKRFLAGVFGLGLAVLQLVAQVSPPAQDYVAVLSSAPLKAPTTAEFAPGATFTMEGWVYLTGSTPYAWLMGKGLATSGSDPYLSFALQIDSSGSKLAFVTSTGAVGSYREIVSPAALPQRVWTHVAAVLDNGQTRLYVNGQLVVSGTSAGAPVAAANVAFGLGSAYLADGSMNYPAFPGAVRQVRFWNVARTGAQIAAVLGESLPSERTGLVAAWPLDESSGTSARDVSGANRTLTGGSWARRAVLEAGPFWTVTDLSPAAGVLDAFNDAIVVDFDSDGDPDLLTLAVHSPPTVPETRLRLRAFRNTGGVFTEATDAVLGTVTMVHPRHHHVADFTGDGRVDVLIVGHGTDTPPFPGEQTKLLVQTSDGRLVDESATRLPLHSSFTHNVAVGDIERDGDLDIYMANVYGGDTGPRFYLNNGSGVFTEATVRLPADIANRTGESRYTSSCLVDVNADSYPDLILGAELAAPPNELLLNDGTGRFTRDARFALPAKLAMTYPTTVAVASADLNADGASDLVLSTTGGTQVLPDGRTITGYSVAGVQLLLNRGDGTFNDATPQLNATFTAGDAWVVWNRLADVNEDGLPDIVLQGSAHSGSTFSKRILLNTGNAVFVDATEVYPGGSLAFVNPADVDRDGRMDLVAIGHIVRTMRNVKSLPVSLFRPATGAPSLSSSPASQTGAAGGNVTLSTSATGAVQSYQWDRNGSNVAGATAATLALANLQPARVGLYRATAANAAGAAASDYAIVGVTTTDKVIGTGVELTPVDVKHPNGNTFDQVLLTGVAESITSDYSLGQITRTSFVDLNGDIVQVEFSGPGTLSVLLDSATGPAAPVNYNQPTASYMKGHPGIVIAGADERTNVSVFTVGRATAFDRTGAYDITKPANAAAGNDPAKNGSPLFEGHANTQYDGVADLAFIAISTTNGKFGGVRTSNAHYFGTRGLTGIYAPGVAFQGPVFVGNIDAFDAATPVLVLGSAADVRVTGGDMAQTNGKAVLVSGVTQLKFTGGSDSHGHLFAAKANKAKFLQNGTDVTAQIVVNPTP